MKYLALLAMCISWTLGAAQVHGCLRHVSHQVVSADPLPNGKCFAVVELCLAKHTTAMTEMDFQLNHREGFIDQQYNVADEPRGHIICHHFEFQTECDMYFSLTGYGRTASKSFCGAWSTFRALPVDIISFGGQYLNNQVCLEWEVANELDIERYVIESSEDGKIFIPQYQVAATASQIEQHTYQECLPYQNNGEYIYRLAIHEVTGETWHSQVISIETQPSESSELTLYPVPCGDVLRIPGSEDQVEIINIQGQRMQYTTGGSDQINVTNLESGWYVARLSNGRIGKFLKK